MELNSASWHERRFLFEQERGFRLCITLNVHYQSSGLFARPNVRYLQSFISNLTWHSSSPGTYYAFSLATHMTDVHPRPMPNFSHQTCFLFRPASHGVFHVRTPVTHLSSFLINHLLEACTWCCRHRITMNCARTVSEWDYLSVAHSHHCRLYVLMAHATCATTVFLHQGLD
jgi:hypothetical protein